MQARGDAGAYGHSMEGVNLDWEALPPRVETAIAQRIQGLNPVRLNWRSV